ncbi:YdeI/OmpD-associated family protein [Balamuthia mandrillaris]
MKRRFSATTALAVRSAFAEFPKGQWGDKPRPKGRSATDNRPLLAFPERASWRAWLSANHDSSGGIWLVYMRKASNLPSVAYNEAVEEALCFGWIDSTYNSWDEHRGLQLFTPRKKGSVWSKLNKQRVARLEEQGLLRTAGIEKIQRAKEDGSWSILDSAEALEIPEDLAQAFESNGRSKARAHFESWAPSSKKGILAWITLAKRAETRAKRIEETAAMAEQGKKALSWGGAQNKNNQQTTTTTTTKRKTGKKTAA